MDHRPAVKHEEHEDSISYKSKVGIKLFFVYALVYVVFVVINTVKPTLMDIKVLYGVNLASIYGFFLIILAVIMGLVYNLLCTKKEIEMENKEGEDK
ncbi:MAG: DUF485 domain-containing protein [Spirochaetaceae bacterium]|nr:DUF485 domain-containing protein [Spirochaetaceae bacterium]